MSRAGGGALSKQRFPRVTAAHAAWLATQKDPALVAPPIADAPFVFPRRMRTEDCWRVMFNYDDAAGRWMYHPGDVVEVLGNDMAWHPGIVTYSRSYEDGAKKSTEGSSSRRW